MAFKLTLPTEQYDNVDTGFQTAPDGAYKTSGFTFAAKEGEMPEFRLMNNEPKVMVRFEVVGQENPPVAALTAPEYVALVRSFGADKFNPTIPQSVEALLEGKKLVDGLKNRKVINVLSENGYVNAGKNPALCPTDGIYTIRFVTAQRKDRENNLFFQLVPSNREGWQPQRLLLFIFEIVGDGNGNPCPFNGFKVIQWMNSPFVSEITLSDGSVVTAAENKGPLMRPSNRTPKAQAMWMAFVKHFCEIPEDYAWQSDPTESVFGVNECVEPQFVFVSNALQVNKNVRVSYREVEGTRYKTFTLSNDMLDALNAELRPMPSGVTALDVIDYITAKYPDLKLFNAEDFTPTDEGKAWLVQNMLGGYAGSEVPEDSLYGLAGITRRVAIGDLTSAEANKLFDVLQKVWEPASAL